MKLSLLFLGLSVASLFATTPFAVLVETSPGEYLAGESTKAGHENWFDARSVSVGADYFFRGGLGSFLPVTFVKEMDAASPSLHQASLKGQRWHQIRLDYLGTDSAASRFSAIVFRNVQLTDYQVLAGGGDPVPREEVTFTYTEIEWTYRSLDPLQEESEAVMNYSTRGGTLDPAFDDDGDGFNNAEDVDDDNDSMSDDYELSNGLDPFSDDALLDRDGDRRSNREEFLAGTGASDPGSFFSISSLRIFQTPEGIEGEVSFPVVGGRIYRVFASADLNAPREQWFEVDSFVTDVEGEAGLISRTLPPRVAATGSRLFYRVEVELID